MYSSILGYTAILSVISAAMWPGVQAHTNNLRRRNNQQVTCPCIDFELDDKLINTETLEIDFHRTRSCVSDKPDVMERIYWTPIDPNNRPQSNMVRPIDGVKFNYLKAIYDTENSIYSCSRNDMLFDDITPEQAEACVNLLKDTCDSVKPRLCSFDLTLMESVKNSVSDGDLILDQDMSCKEPTNIGGEYGIFTKASSLYSIPAISSNKDEISSDSRNLVSDEMNELHCTNLITSTCSGWQLTRSQDSQCVDDPNFVLHGNFFEEELESIQNLVAGTTNTIKNCAWVAEDRTRCRTLSKDTGLRVFESCRQTCGTCTCSDNEGYRFNGQADKGCAWIKEDTSSRCTLEGASENCKAACDTKCCKDNSKFRFMQDEKKTCSWARKNRADRCKKRAVASNCPETCGLCPSS